MEKKDGDKNEMERTLDEREERRKKQRTQAKIQRE